MATGTGVETSTNQEFKEEWKGMSTADMVTVEDVVNVWILTCLGLT